MFLFQMLSLVVVPVTVVIQNSEYKRNGPIIGVQLAIKFPEIKQYSLERFRLLVYGGVYRFYRTLSFFFKRRFVTSCRYALSSSIITDKRKTHSRKGFSVYLKCFLVNAYNSLCLIPNCYICLKIAVS